MAMDQFLSPSFETKKIFLRCIDIEIAAAEIYTSFMRMFPEERTFWGQLALEEEDHARLYLAYDLMKVSAEHGEIRLPLPEFIEKTAAFAQRLLQLIDSRPISLKEAVEMALTLEKTIVESIIFELPDSNNQMIKNLRRIIDETESHVDRIERFRIEKGFSYPG